jgi:hypothetical protein
MAKQDKTNTGSEIVLYQAEDRALRIEVRLESGTVWLSQAQMAELYQSTVANINLHLKAIFAEGRRRAPAQHLRRGRAGRDGNHPEIPDRSPRRDKEGRALHRPLQPGGHPGRGISRLSAAFAARNSVLY